MASWLLTWNPRKYRWEGYDDAVRQARSGKGLEAVWSCAHTRSIGIGDRLYLLRQGSERGLIASGKATAEPFEDEHWDEQEAPGKAQHFVSLLFDTLLPVAHVLPIQVLQDAVPSTSWNRVQASGIRVKDPKGLEALWTGHLKSLKQR